MRCHVTQQAVLSGGIKEIVCSIVIVLLAENVYQQIPNRVLNT